MLEILREYRPRLVVADLKEPDSRGHAADWKGYLRAIRRFDAYAYRLWKFLREAPRSAGRTAFFLTNGHGRHLDEHADGFVNHGDACEGCRRILLFASGPGFPGGRIVGDPADQTDLAVTLAALLGVELPGSPGRPLTVLFSGE